MSGELEVVILGSGSSGGVPRGDGDWGACDPAEPKNRRLRCSLLVRRHGPAGVTSVVIDTSPDLREQMLGAGVKHVDAVLYTHDHADQTHGIDDLRTFAARARRRLPAWMDAATRAALTRRFDYIFESRNGYPALLDAHDLPPPSNIPSTGEITMNAAVFATPDSTTADPPLQKPAPMRPPTRACEELDGRP